MNVTTGTFEEYLEAMAPYVREAVRRQVGVKARNGCNEERVKHAFLSYGDLEQECHLKLWKVYEQHHKSKPWQDMCRIGGAAIKGCILDQVDRTLVRGQGSAEIESLDYTKHIGADDDDQQAVDLIQDAGESPIEAAEYAEELDSVAVSLEETERLILRELITMSNRTLELFEEIRRKAPKTRKTDSIRFEAISKSLEVPFKTVLKIIPKLLKGLDGMRRDTTE